MTKGGMVIQSSTKFFNKALCILLQRNTQTLSYWQKQFSINNQEIEAIYNKILEENRLFSLDEIAISLVRTHCEAEERASRAELDEGRLYQPKELYEVGEKIVFSMMEFATGIVQHIRTAQHPDYGEYSVAGVQFGNSDALREFAINFSHDHPLNSSDHALGSNQGLLGPEELYQSYHSVIYPKVKVALDGNDDFVEFHGHYYLQDLLTEFQEGLFNIVDAAIDINGGPLGVDALIEQMGLTSDQTEITDVVRFSVGYRLATDERFNDVGPSGQSLWYLDRLQPPEVLHAPRRLQLNDESYDVGLLDDNLFALLVELDDEGTHPDDTPAVGDDIKDITLVLNYPHRRVGTLPLTPKTQSFFPSSSYNPVRFEFVDGRTGDTFSGWTVLEHQYVFGLDEWYNKNKLPVGAYIKIKRSKDPMQVIVDYQSTRTQREWIRMAAAQGNKLTFQMNKEALSCKYDDLMVIGERNPTEIDQLWLTAEDRDVSLYKLLCDIFPELSKLNPQSTVHAKTLYSAVNIVRRASPGIVFQELIRRDCFIPVDHAYWTYDPSLRD